MNVYVRTQIKIYNTVNKSQKQLSGPMDKRKRHETVFSYRLTYLSKYWCKVILYVRIYPYMYEYVYIRRKHICTYMMTRLLSFFGNFHFNKSSIPEKKVAPFSARKYLTIRQLNIGYRKQTQLSSFGQSVCIYNLTLLRGICIIIHTYMYYNVN